MQWQEAMFSNNPSIPPKMCFVSPCKDVLRYTYMCHMHHSHISYTSIHTPAIPLIWWTKNLEPELGPSQQRKSMMDGERIRKHIITYSNLSSIFFKITSNYQVGNKKRPAIYMSWFFLGWRHDFSTTICIRQTFTLKPPPPTFWGIPNWINARFSRLLCLKTSMQSCDGMRRVVLFGDRCINVFSFAPREWHFLTNTVVLTVFMLWTLNLAIWVPKHTKLKRKNTNRVSPTQRWQQSRCSMPHVRPLGGRFWLSHSPCCNANSNCHSAKPGSSNCVRLCFFTKNIYKKVKICISWRSRYISPFVANVVATGHSFLSTNWHFNPLKLKVPGIASLRLALRNCAGHYIDHFSRCVADRCQKHFFSKVSRQ